MIVVLPLLIIVIIIAIYASSIAAYFSATWLFLVGLSWWTYTKQHPMIVVSGISAYFLVGAVWSVLKWYFVESERAAKAREAFEIRGDKNQTWNEFISDSYRYNKTRVSNHKEDIAIWIGFWPLNMVWTLIDDFVWKIANRIYRELLAVYQRITNHVWK